MQGLANKCTEGDMTQLVNSMNDFFVSVSADLPRLDPTHRVFDIEEPLPAEFTIEAASTQWALQNVKCRKSNRAGQHSSVDGEKLCTPVSCAARHAGLFSIARSEKASSPIFGKLLLSFQFQRNIHPAHWKTTSGRFHLRQYWRKYLKELY